MAASGCPSDDELIGYTNGGLDDPCRDRVERHIDACSRCIALVGGIARGSNAGVAPWSGPPPARLLAEGDVIANRYFVRRMLGAGAMGEVYEAEDQLLGKTIALKTLNAVVAADANALTRLRSEVALAHQVTHPNVCRIHDLGVDVARTGEPLRFLTMEYLDGRTLSAYLREDGPPSLERAHVILEQLASALAAAHAVGVIHRDLKGDNVMLVKQAGGNIRAVVTDFGLAGPIPAAEIRLAAERFTYSSTHAHVAPEQLAGKAANPATDVYSFGLLAYHVLTGKSPTAQDSRIDVFADENVLERIQRDDLAASLRWQRFLREALHPDAKRRIPNGAALVAALRAFAPRTTLSRRRRWAYGGLTLSLGGAAALIGWARSQPAPPLAVRPTPIAAFAAAEAKTPPPPAPPPPAPPPAAVVSPTPVAARARAPRRVAPGGQPDKRAVAGPEAKAAERETERPTQASDEIVRDLPSRPRPAASQEDLADPFAARRPEPRGDER
jgi:serine/threonine protein kinase